MPGGMPYQEGGEVLESQTGDSHYLLPRRTVVFPYWDRPNKVSSTLSCL